MLSLIEETEAPISTVFGENEPPQGNKIEDAILAQGDTEDIEFKWLQLSDFHSGYIELKNDQAEIQGGQTNFEVKYSNLFPQHKKTVKIVNAFRKKDGACVGTGQLFIEKNHDQCTGLIDDFAIMEDKYTWEWS